MSSCTTSANAVGNPNSGGAHSIFPWFNAAAFVAPRQYTGTKVGTW